MAREHGMIEPFEGRQVREGVISYGVSSYGYDMRVAREFRIFTNVLNSIVDPKHFDPKSFVEFEGDVCIVPPNSFALARSVEYFRIPRDVVTICVGKSTNEGIAQVLFFRGEEEPEVSYKDKAGKYQGQVGVTLPRL
jgi:dCTP deaminase